MMYRSRNSNPSQPNPKPLLFNKYAKIKYPENPNSATEKMRSLFLQVSWTHTRKSRNGWDTGSHHPPPCLHLNWLRLPSSSSCPLPPNLPLLDSPHRLNSREVVILFFFTLFVGIMTPFSDDRQRQGLVGVKCVTCISALTQKWELPHHKSNPTQHLQ